MIKFDIRWSDVDPNRHLANYAYVNFMSQARLELIRENGITQKVMDKHNMRPIAFYEKMYYLKEVNSR